MQKKVFKINYCNISLSFKKGDFITILGNDNNLIAESFTHGIISYENILDFKKVTVIDEIQKHSKITNKINKYLKEFNLIEYKNDIASNLNINEKIKLLILIEIIKNNNILIVNNILSLLDFNDYKLVLSILKKYAKDNIVINLTNSVNESLFGNKIAIIYDKTLVCFGKTLSVLNEEKTFKRLGIGLPFIVELNKYLMDYGLIDKYYLSNKKLVSALWK